MNKVAVRGQLACLRVIGVVITVMVRVINRFNKVITLIQACLELRASKSSSSSSSSASASASSSSCLGATAVDLIIVSKMKDDMLV